MSDYLDFLLRSKLIDEHKVHDLLRKVDDRLRKFEEEYTNKKKSEVDVEGLSEYELIYLMCSITEFKLKHLNNDYFWKNPYTLNYFDNFITSLKIGNFSYLWESRPTDKQPGNGILYGMTEKLKALRHWEIQQAFNNNKELAENSMLLWKQKRDGKAIDTGDEEVNRFLNGHNLLLALEVARRRIKGDHYKDLPIISWVNSVINNPCKFDQDIFNKMKN